MTVKRRKNGRRALPGNLVGEINGFPIRRVNVKDLNPADYNPRAISDPALEGLRVSTKTFGLPQAIVWNKRTQRIVGGHQRLKTLDPDGTTDVVEVDLDDDHERALNVALNSRHIAGEFTRALGEILADLEVNVPELTAGLRFEELQLDTTIMIPDDDDGGDDDGEPEPTPEEEKPRSKKGRVYELGPHRLVCGDARNARLVERLLDGVLPSLMITDPPYGVEYDPRWRQKASKKGTIHSSGQRHGTEVESLGRVDNDDQDDWREAWELFPGDIAYVWHGGLSSDVVKTSLESTGFIARSQIIWKKPSFAISQGHYNWQHEPCWYVVRKGKTARWCGGGAETTVWEVAPVGMSKNEDEVTTHSTQKPVELMTRAIKNHRSKVIYDPFLGSGTTLIAAAKLGRRCYGVELNPRFVDGIRKRWGKWARAHGEDPGPDAL